ncbi:hypothetical protein MGL_3998 [Malassezia globosa CBS 7966]|uniref:PPIase cyclophilin-type domain-containing protein n=1 Tax=Malassezia globosa (strain ATCC MYA-4612 / CBS 7966) TaxID=425265 RepID=A8QCE0_MALGO|nr:uncharacterized protein MGL_3998 [Malassezia globosa CBS 7966]EDP41617.1 hypothetical protein MGL_3998 [Malassezia globosa CBS 7966]
MSSLYVTEPPTDGKVILHTAKGEIEIELWSKEAPKACRNFVALALEGYYDSCVWHRIVPNFIIQTGDPSSTGHGGESFFGAPFENEIHQRLRFNRRGLVAMANAGEKCTNESQFFITLDATPELQNKYTIFGRVVGSTIYNVLSLANIELSTSVPDRPVFPPKLLQAEVVHNPFRDLVPRITSAERAAQNSARSLAAERLASMERQRKKQKKNTTLLSFGEEEDVPPEPEAKKPMSSHDLLNDKRLSKQTYDFKKKDENKQNPLELQVSVANSSSQIHDEHRKSHMEESSLNKITAREKDPWQSTLSENSRSKVETNSVGKNAYAIPASTEVWGDEAHMREYGDSDDDDSDWRSHKFNSGGIPLHNSNDQFSVQDYQVLDSRDTRNPVAKSLGFGGSDSVQHQESQFRKDKIMAEGRRGGN